MHEFRFALGQACQGFESYQRPLIASPHFNSRDCRKNSKLQHDLRPVYQEQMTLQHSTLPPWETLGRTQLHSKLLG